MFKIPVRIYRESPTIKIPKYSYKGDAGFDLASNENIVLSPTSVTKISTGLKFEIPEGYEIQIRSRSGLASTGIIINNAPGTIDCGYRDEVMLIVMNQTNNQFAIRKGDRLAQGVLAECLQAEFLEVDSVGDMVESDRGERGLGSSGT